MDLSLDDPQPQRDRDIASALGIEDTQSARDDALASAIATGDICFVELLSCHSRCDLEVAVLEMLLFQLGLRVNNPLYRAGLLRVFLKRFREGNGMMPTIDMTNTTLLARLDEYLIHVSGFPQDQEFKEGNRHYALSGTDPAKAYHPLTGAPLAGSFVVANEEDMSGMTKDSDGNTHWGSFPRTTN